jgi:hypothetical protein
MNYFMLRAVTTAAVAATFLANPTPALADLSAFVMAAPASQVALSGSVRIGTLVDAHTNLNNIWASISYKVECSDLHVHPGPQGDQAGTNNGFLGPRHLTLTAPEVYTTDLPLPGWSAVTAGTSFDCTHSYSAAAKTSILPIGSGGTAFPLGGDSWSESSFQVFDVVKSGSSGTGGCIP